MDNISESINSVATKSVELIRREVEAQGRTWVLLDKGASTHGHLEREVIERQVGGIVKELLGDRDKGITKRITDEIHAQVKQAVKEGKTPQEILNITRGVFHTAAATIIASEAFAQNPSLSPNRVKSAIAEVLYPGVPVKELPSEAKKMISETVRSMTEYMKQFAPDSERPASR